MKLHISALRFYILAILLFIIDVSAFSFLEKQVLYGLLCLFCLQIIQPPAPGRLAFLAALLSLESFLYYGRFGIQLVFLIPLAVLGYILQELFYKKGLLAPVLLLIALLVQSIGIEYGVLGLTPSLGYTFSKIFVTLSVLWIISLTYK